MDGPVWSSDDLRFSLQNLNPLGYFYKSQPTHISSAAKIAVFLWIHPISIPKGCSCDWRVLVLWFTLDVKIIGTCTPAHALKLGEKHSTRGFISLRSLISFYSLQMWRHTRMDIHLKLLGRLMQSKDASYHRILQSLTSRDERLCIDIFLTDM